MPLAKIQALQSLMHPLEMQCVLAGVGGGAGWCSCNTEPASRGWNYAEMVRARKFFLVSWFGILPFKGAIKIQKWLWMEFNRKCWLYGNFWRCLKLRILAVGSWKNCAWITIWKMSLWNCADMNDGMRRGSFSTTVKSFALLHLEDKRGKGKNLAKNATFSVREEHFQYLRLIIRE